MHSRRGHVCSHWSVCINAICSRHSSLSFAFEIPPLYLIPSEFTVQRLLTLLCAATLTLRISFRAIWRLRAVTPARGSSGPISERAQPSDRSSPHPFLRLTSALPRYRATLSLPHSSYVALWPRKGWMTDDLNIGRTRHRDPVAPHNTRAHEGAFPHPANTQGFAHESHVQSISYKEGLPKDANEPCPTASQRLCRSSKAVRVNNLGLHKRPNLTPKSSFPAPSLAT